MNTNTTIANSNIYGTYTVVSPNTYLTSTPNSVPINNSSISTTQFTYTHPVISATEYNANTQTIKINGTADVDGDILVKGKSVLKLLKKMEERLAILEPNFELEERWVELKELSKRYQELEAELLEKEKVWKILKK